MFNASSLYNEPEEFRKLKRDFVKFGEESSVGTDVLEICSLISRYKQRDALKLMEYFVDKMVAVKEDDFESAIVARDLIKELLKR